MKIDISFLAAFVLIGTDLLGRAPFKVSNRRLLQPRLSTVLPARCTYRSGRKRAGNYAFIDELLDYGLAAFLPGFRQTGFGRSGINGWPDGFWLTTE